MELTKSFIVKPEYTASSVGSGSLEVLSTPYLAAFMENVGFEILENIVGEGYTSVGVYIELRHVKATKTGKELKVVGKIIEKDGKKVKFSIKAYEDDQLVGECLHERVIVNISNFLKKIV